MRITKSKLGFWLLLSLVPTFLGIVAIFAIDFLPDEENTTAGSLLAILMILYFPIGLVVGVVMSVWGKVEKNVAFTRAHQYAELNGWHPISDTMWRSRKREGAALSVAKAYQKTTYILTIEYQEETTTVDEFANALWALQFGDWLWEELKSLGQPIDAVGIEQKRTEWEKTRALAIRSG